MAVEIHRHPDHPEGDAERIAKRLRNSGEGSMPNVHAKHGEGPLRTHTNIHHSGHYVQPNTQAKPTDGEVARVDASKVGGVGR
jgi:hypothetical protein